MASLDAYEIAKQGGPHAGFLKRHEELPDHLLEKSARSFLRQIAEHRSWIEHPESKLGAGGSARKVGNLVTRKWPKDIERLEEQLAVIEGILRERKR